jgi:hypothetical protein
MRYPFGMTMPARTYSAKSGYRYGFNGQDKSPEVSENSTTAEFWQYDARIGRRFNVDPKGNINESSYSCFYNNPIFIIDILGNAGEPNKQTGEIKASFTFVRAEGVTDEQYKKSFRKF